MICAKVQRVGRARSKRHGSIEEDIICAVDSVSGDPISSCGGTAEEWAPTGFGGVGYIGHAGIPDLSCCRAALVEIGVIHGDIGCVRAALVNQSKTAVTGIRARPRAGGIHQLGAVVLSATDHEVRVFGVKSKALELRGAEACGVQAGPGGAGVNRFENSTVIAGVDDAGI